MTGQSTRESRVAKRTPIGNNQDVAPSLALALQSAFPAVVFGAVVLSVVNEVLWANYPQVYLASVGVVMLLAVLFMSRGIVNLGMKNGWLAVGRPLFRRLAARAGQAS